jgi:uncharacterized membrane protein
LKITVIPPFIGALVTIPLVVLVFVTLIMESTVKVMGKKTRLSHIFLIVALVALLGFIVAVGVLPQLGR